MDAEEGATNQDENVRPWVREPGLVVVLKHISEHARTHARTHTHTALHQSSHSRTTSGGKEMLMFTFKYRDM